MSPQRFRLAMAVALVATVGALAGILFAAHPGGGTATAVAATSTPSPSPHPHAPRGGFFGRGGIGGGSGTVTAISGSTLTLRTLTGTLTVDTTSSTTYSKAGRTISFSDIKVDDVLQVRPVRPSGSATPPASPPTTVTAQSITVVLPAFFGRVDSISGPTIFVVTHDGQIAYVYTTSATTYTSNGNTASFGDIKTGDYIAAQGTQTDLKHLTADHIVISTSPPGPAFGPGGPPMHRFGGWHAPASPAPTASGTAT